MTWLWSDFIRSLGLFVQPDKFLTPETKIFRMGSCFVPEIHRALTRKGYAVHPRYKDVAFNPTVQMFDTMREREGTAHYDTFVIRQEFESALGLWTDRDADFCEVRGALQ